MQFKDLVFTEWKFNDDWMGSQDLIYDNKRIRVFHRAAWSFGKNTYDVDFLDEFGSVVKTLHEDLDLLTLCSAVLPFCTPYDLGE